MTTNSDKKSAFHYGFGVRLSRLNRFEAAVNQFEKAIAIDDGFCQAHIKLGLMYHFLQRYPESLKHLLTAVTLEPNNAEGLYYLAFAVCLRGKLKQAQCYLERAEAANPNESGLYQQAFARYTKAISQSEQSNKGVVVRSMLEWMTFPIFEVRKFIQPRWDGTPLNGRSLLLYGEGGLGDQIQFVRYLPNIQKMASGRIVLECNRHLMELFSKISGQHIKYLAQLRPYDPGQRTSDRPDYDVRLGMISSPLLCSLDDEPILAKIPYLEADPVAAKKWQSRLGQCNGLKVGLRWAGNMNHWNDKYRSCKLFEFLPLLGLPGIAWYSLQKEAATSELTLLPSEVQIQDLSEDLTNMTETAALIANLDLVISVDTSMAHLAGALGKPVWMLVAYGADPRWGIHAHHTAWYPTMRLFRQDQPSDWKYPIKMMADHLQEFRESGLNDVLKSN